MSRAAFTGFAGRIWPAGRTLGIPGLVVENQSAAVDFKLKEDHDICPDPTLANFLLEQRPISVPAEFWKVQTYVYHYPGATVNTHLITCILIRDLDSTGNGGTVKVLDGGVNDYKFSAEFTSKRGHGLNYEVVIYADTPTTTLPPATAGSA